MMQLKICKQCNENKTLTEFHKAGSRSIGGVRARCKKCINENNRKHWPFYYTENQQLISKRRRKRYSSLRKSFLKSLYDLSEEDYNTLWQKQGGKCAICNNPETRRKNGRAMKLCVDHNHINGIIRGLLCFRCNLGVGNLLDTPELTDGLICYLTKWKGK